MALPQRTVALAIVMVLASANMELVRSLPVKGSVSCADCGSSYNYSGIRVMVKCDLSPKPAIATTKQDGSFEAKLPSNPRSPANCKARLLGGPKQLYALNHNMVSKLTMVVHHPNAYATSTTLTFASCCSTLRKSGNCAPALGSSKTIDLPIPPEFGLPPTSYYVTPFLPIIGIP